MKCNKCKQYEESGMTTAIWLIAVCEIVRILQNMIQLSAIRHDTAGRDNAYAEFVKSLKQSDKEFVRKMLEEFEKEGKDVGNH